MVHEGETLRRAGIIAAVMILVTGVLIANQNCSGMGVGNKLLGQESQNQGGNTNNNNNNNGPGGPVIPEAGKLCPELDVREGSVQVENVGPGQAAALPGLIQSAVPGTAFILSPGVYNLSGPLQFNTAGLRLASSTGRPEDVILDGNHQGGSIIQISAPNVVIANVTVRRSYYHLIHFVDGGVGGRVYNVQLEDGRQQFIKSSSFTTPSDNVEVACSSFLLTPSGRSKVDPSSGGCYTGGIDAHKSRNWWVRDNVFRDIYCTNGGLAEHAVHFWNSSRDTLVERNFIHNCARGIGFGLGETKDTVGRVYDDYPDITTTAAKYAGHIGGVIRNNLIVASTQNRFDTGIGLEQAIDAKVHHNTVYSTDAATFAALDIRFVNSNPDVANNLLYPTSYTRGGGMPNTYIANVIAKPEYFKSDPDLGIRLDPEHAEVISKIRDQGVVLVGAELDLEGKERDENPDIGAVELPPKEEEKK